MKYTSRKAYIFKRAGIRGKKASSFWFIYTLAFAFILAILYIIFGQILTVYLYPTTEFLSNGNTVAPDKWLTYWGWMPWIILLIIGTFMFFKLTQVQG